MVKPEAPVEAFRKPAHVPLLGGSEVAEEAKAEVPESPPFGKKTPVPRFEPPVAEPPPPPRSQRAPGRSSQDKEKEEKDLATFTSKALELYQELWKRGQDMEIGRILELAGDDEKEWYKTFESLVRPRRAATGLRYCRLASRYLTWFQGKEADAGCSYSFFDSDMIWHYLKDLCSEGVGRFTPKSTVHALQFFAEAFGCKFETGAYKRVRKIAEQHTWRMSRRRRISLSARGSWPDV